MSKSLDDKVEQFKRQEIDKMLAQCTEKQRERWAVIFPNGVPVDSLNSAYGLCERTLQHNAQNASNAEKDLKQ